MLIANLARQSDHSHRAMGEARTHDENTGTKLTGSREQDQDKRGEGRAEERGRPRLHTMRSTRSCGSPLVPVSFTTEAEPCKHKYGKSIANAEKVTCTPNYNDGPEPS